MSSFVGNIENIQVAFKSWSQCSMASKLPWIQIKAAALSNQSVFRLPMWTLLKWAALQEETLICRGISHCPVAVVTAITACKLQCFEQRKRCCAVCRIIVTKAEFKSLSHCVVDCQRKGYLCQKLIFPNTVWNNVHALCSLTIEAPCQPLDLSLSGWLLHLVKAVSGNLLSFRHWVMTT